MKKKLLSILLIFGLVFVFAACSLDDSDYDSGDMDDFEVEDDIEDYENSGGFDDELELLAWEPNEENSENNFFLLRDGRNYSLGAIDYEMAETYLPYSLNVYNGECCSTYSGIVKSIPGGFFSLGEVPVPVIGEGDKIVSYSSENVPVLRLLKANYYGCAVRLETNPGYDNLLDRRAEAYWLDPGTTEVRDSGGDLVEDIYNLNEGDEYMVSWYEGTQYNELSLPADSKFYVLEGGSTGRADYEIDGALTKDGYAEYDLSGVSPGIYAVVNGYDLSTHALIIIE